MKTFIYLILSCLIFAQLAFAEEKTSEENTILYSYQKEISFLNSYKVQTAKKLSNLQKQTAGELEKGRIELRGLENQWLNLQEKAEKYSEKITQLEKENEESSDKRSGLDAILEQSQQMDKELKFDDKQNLITKLEASFASNIKSLTNSAKVTVAKGDFFDSKGNKVSGQILSFGNISKFAMSDKTSGLLYPVGGGAFRIWKDMSADKIAQIDKNKLADLPLFIYESEDMAYSLPEKKSLMGTVQAGGAIAWVLVVMGFVALALSIMRFLLLRRAQSSDETILNKVYQFASRKEFDKALEISRHHQGPVFRIISETLLCHKNNKSEIVEDVISENILRESLVIDKFGTVLTIIASIATLLGLLGTVTGMINTFEMITEYGNTNPKMLSGGISEALITTEFGLIIAIPTILVGQILNSWNEKIKTKMEESAIAVCNRVHNG